MVPTVRITLDRERTLRFDFNAFCDLHAACAKEGLDHTAIDTTNMAYFRLMLWAGLRGDDPKITVRDVGRLLDEHGVEAVAEAMERAYSSSQPDDTPDPPKARGSSSRTSGRSASSTSGSRRKR